MSDLWVFGYGSLMWRPGFEHDESQPALLRGAHRSLCVYSIVHRGTARRPGLVLGLDTGGSCRGIAFRVAPRAAPATLDYLRQREQVTDVYVEARRPVTLLDGSRRKVEALCFLVDTTHRQYTGRLPVAEQAELVREGHGASGNNVDYIANTLRHLDEMGFSEPSLRQVMDALGADTGQGRNGCFSSPPLDGEGEGQRRGDKLKRFMRQLAHSPHPNPPPQGGRELTGSTLRLIRWGIFREVSE